jgi:hypothetical protein
MRRPFFLLLLCMMTCMALRAQYSVKLILDAIPPKHPDDAIYIMGDFNNWNPNDPQSQLTKDASGKFTITDPDVPAGIFQIKMTRGSKVTTECAGDGKPIANRSVTVNSDTTFHYVVAGWSDDFPKTVPVATPGSGATPTAYLNKKVVPSRAR